MSRSKWKGSFFNLKFLTFKKKKLIKIWNRNSVIPSSLINKSILVHNGIKYKIIKITREKIGFKFGEFSFTRALERKSNPKKKTRIIKKK